MKGKAETISKSKHILLIAAAMLLAMGICFMLNNSKAYAAEGDVVGQSTYKGVDWVVKENASGNLTLELGKEGETRTFVGDVIDPDLLAEGMRLGTNDGGYADSTHLDSLARRNAIPWHADRFANITEVRIVGNIIATGAMSYMFAGMENVTSMVGLNKINTDGVTSMNSLFGFHYTYGDGAVERKGCSKLTSIDISSWNTENVLDMGCMFYYTTSLSDLKLGSNFKTNKTLSFGEMFAWSGLPALDLSGFETDALYSMNSMFFMMPNIQSLDLSHFNTANVESMTTVFCGARNLSNINVSGWDVSNVKKMWSMFESTDAKVIDLSTWTKASSLDGSLSRMFANCANLEEIKGLDNLDTSKITDATEVFANCAKLVSADMIVWDLGNVTKADNMFKGADKIADAIRAEANKPGLSADTKEKINAAAAAVEAAAAGQTDQEALNTLKTVTTAGKFVTADNDRKAADTAVTKARNAENQAKIAKEALDAAKAENPQDPAKIAAAQEAYDAKKKAADDAYKAAEEAVAKAIASAEATGNDQMKNNANATADNLKKVEIARNAREAGDAVADAKDKTDGALKEAETVSNGSTQADLDKANKALKEARDALAELQKAKEAAEKALADAIAKYGPNSQQAKDAQAALDKVNSQIATTTQTITRIETIVKTIEKNISTKNVKPIKVKTITVNVKTVSAAAINKAVAKKGGNKKYVTKIILGKKVKKIKKGSFKQYKKVKTIEVKTKKLTKKSVKGSLKGSKITTVKVKVGSKKVNKKYVKKYKKIFTKKNAGKKVKVKR